MSKNIKRMFFVLTVVTLLVTVGAVSAADDVNGTTAVDISVSDVTTVSDSASDHIVAESVTTTSNDKVGTKTIEKEEKNIKTATKTVEVNDFDELTDAINEVVDFDDIDNYIINLNEGEYECNNVRFNDLNDNTVITINANGQTLSGSQIRFNYPTTIIINNAIITLSISNRYTTLTLTNSTLDGRINNQMDGTLIISDDVIIGDGFILSNNNGRIISNKTELIDYGVYPGDNVLNNTVISIKIENIGNMNIVNSTIESEIFNWGNLTIEDLTVDNIIYNHGNLTVKNTTLNSTIKMDYPEGVNPTLTIADDVIIGDGFKIDFTYNWNVKIIINDYGRIFKHMDSFYYEATVELGNYTKEINNYGNLTIENTTFSATKMPVIEAVIGNQKNAKMIIRNSTTNTQNPFNNKGTMEIYNSTIDTWIANTGVLIISEDTNIGENFKITGSGEIITTHPKLLVDYVDIWESDVTLNNQTITTPKTSYGIVSLNNCTINTTITNQGTLIIDNNTIFEENAKITGNGKIETNNITKLLPFIDTINGNYEIKDTTLNKRYTFNGEITITNCTINNPNNTNFGKLNLNNCTVDVDEENTFLTNYGTIDISDDTNIIGKIVNLVNNGAYIITQDTIEYFLNEKGLTSIVKPGDTLDIQGTIKLNKSLVINKPVNIISTTNDAYIDLDTHAGSMVGDSPGNCFIINNDGSYTNVTGIYFHNTQLWIYNTHHVTLDNISAVVENQAVGSGVGQTSIRANSTYVTLKNSFIYTKNNGGSSSVVLAWADNCLIQNNTIQGVGAVGNLVYLTTYNVDVPEDVVPNCNNQILDNVIIGPDQSSAICIPIMLSGANNTIANNLIYYVGGSGIGGQWDGEGYTDTQNNTMKNNTHISHAPQNELIIDTTDFTAGETATINANIVYTNKVLTDINKGKVTFKVNGKTLKDANGKVIYTKVVNGTATIENYLVPDDWAKEGTTIEAVYSGSTQCEKLTSEKTNITITSPEPTITITPITSDVQTGSTVTLKAKVAAGDKAITTGKIVFKVNGKTVKDANGKVIYAKVNTNGEVSVDYTIPESFKAGTYNIEAVFTASGYEKLTDNTTMTVIKS